MAEDTKTEAPPLLQTNVPAAEDAPGIPAIPFGARTYVMAADGRRVRSPDHGNAPLPAVGDWVSWSIYWERRRQDGDIVVTDPKPSEAPVQTPAAPPPPAPPPPSPPPPAPKAAKADNDKEA